jgi:hypothetical protein
MTMTAQERAILALCRMEGRSLECGWLTFDKLTPAEKMTFAENIWPLIKPRLPILAAEFEAAAAALDGEGEREEWTAEPSGERRHLGNAHERPHWHVRRANATIVASTFTEQNARQIASDHNRCAKLKRAAREVDKAIDAYDTARSLYGSDDPRRIARIRQLTEARGNLRAFLNDEGKP